MAHSHDHQSTSYNQQLAEANKKYYDDKANWFDQEEWQVKMINQLKQAVSDHLDWMGVAWTDSPKATASDGRPHEVRMLDYACGTGAISEVIQPHVTHLLGIDVSPKVIEAYNELARSRNLSPERMSGIVGDLLGESPPPMGLEWSSVDLITVGMAYHHLASPADATRRFAEHLAPGGVLFISDFLAPRSEDEKPPEAVFDKVKGAVTSHAVHGFTEDGIRKMFADAGLVDVKISVLEEKFVMILSAIEVRPTVFFARGVKPRSSE